MKPRKETRFYSTPGLPPIAKIGGTPQKIIDLLADKWVKVDEKFYQGEYGPVTEATAFTAILSAEEIELFGYRLGPKYDYSMVTFDLDGSPLLAVSITEEVAIAKGFIRPKLKSLLLGKCSECLLSDIPLHFIDGVGVCACCIDIQRAKRRRLRIQGAMREMQADSDLNEVSARLNEDMEESNLDRLSLDEVDLLSHQLDMIRSQGGAR